MRENWLREAWRSDGRSGGGLDASGLGKRQPDTETRNVQNTAQQAGQAGSEMLLPLPPTCMTVMDPALVPRSDRAKPFMAAQESTS